MTQPTCTRPDHLIVRLRGWWHYPQCLVLRYPLWELPPGFPWCTCINQPEYGIPDQQPTWI